MNKYNYNSCFFLNKNANLLKDIGNLLMNNNKSD